jgi:hypothetical protein
MAEMNLEKLTEFCAAILEIQNEPDSMEILSKYLDIAKAANEGKLTPEAMAKFKELNAFIIQTVHEQSQAAPGGAA